jgi:hypothetical protein
LVEHSLGKGEVTGSIPVISSRSLRRLMLIGFRVAKMDQQKRFYVAMAAYAVLALLVWFTMDGSAVPVGGGWISFRGLTLAVLGFFAIRTIWYRNDMSNRWE